MNEDVLWSLGPRVPRSKGPKVPSGGLLIDIFPSHCVKSATLPANQIMKPVRLI